MGRKTQNITGQQFGLWTVIERAGYIYGTHAAFRCRCDCGTISIVSGSSLRHGGTTNCGCNQRAGLGDRVRTHGKSKHPMYITWVAMRERCEREGHVHFHHYGGRGIRVCDLWQQFEGFYQDMRPSWFAGSSIDRIDPNAGYFKDNCRWATSKEQARNRRNTTFIALRGETLPLSEWAEITGISPGTLRSRINLGWTDARVLETPVRAKAR